MELKTPLKVECENGYLHKSTSVYDANGIRRLWVVNAGEEETAFVAELVRRANAYDAMRAALHTIAYEPIGYEDSSHRDVLDRITEIARDALAVAKGGA